MLDVPSDDEEQEYNDPCIHVDRDCLCAGGNQHRYQVIEIAC